MGGLGGVGSRKLSVYIGTGERETEAGITEQNIGRRLYLPNNALQPEPIGFQHPTLANGPTTSSAIHPETH